MPNGVEVDIKENNIIVKGPKGTLTQTIHPTMKLEIKDGTLNVARPDETLLSKSLHGLTRTLVRNMVVGVTEGYLRTLDIVGVGYKAEKSGDNLILRIGFSHPVTVEPLEGVVLDVDGPSRIKVSGIDKEKVGRQAADIRAIRKPDAYKGKGIRYSEEKVITKAGKAVGKGAK